MKYIIDSYAWIAYLEGGASGEKVDKLLKQEHEFYVLLYTIAEVVSRVERKGMDKKLAFNSMINNARIVELSVKDAYNAGIIHVQMRKNVHNFGLGDSILLSKARKMNAKIVTGDPHFKGFKEVLFLS